MSSTQPPQRPAEAAGVLADEEGPRPRVGRPSPTQGSDRPRPSFACGPWPARLRFLLLLSLLALGQTPGALAAPIRRGGPLFREAIASRAQRLMASSTPPGVAAQRLSVQGMGGRGLSVAAIGPLRAGGYWDRYYTRALADHKLQVQGPNALRVLSVYNGQLPDSPFVEYLLWRRSLNPTRFDHYHPGLGRLLEAGNVGVTVDPKPVVPPGPPVPEPATWLMGGLLAAGGLWKHRRQRRDATAIAVS